MKTFATKLKSVSVAFVLLLTIVCFFPFFQTGSAQAESFSSASVGDSNFTMQVSATGREKTVALPLNKQDVTVGIADATLSYTYYCFQWRDIENLTFNFTSNILNSTNIFSSYELKLTYVESESLNSPFGNGEERVLVKNGISANQFENFEFYFYIDKAAKVYESSNLAKGNDFGLYKFDFSYTYSDGENENIKRSIGEIYIAILPDNIDTVTHENDLKILYSVSSSQKLMNNYNLYLSTDDYKYVNPKYIEWIVVGVDKEKTSYVYCERNRQENIMYANYKAIWPTAQVEPFGNSFVFDSNDIEGEWTANCIIKDSQGNEKARFTAEGLTTIKNKKASYIWLILTVVLSVLLIGGIVALVIFYLKREKIW